MKQTVKITVILNHELINRYKKKQLNKAVNIVT